ncbi:MAG TPA: M57 family metalloprotease [Flavisolibacter sp.]|nr:M57 family metalloprotease [Flavisolibacter sp.]
MKKMLIPFVAVIVIACSIVACKKEAKETNQKEEISQDALSKIKALGFGTTDVRKVDEGYLVEGDIVLTNENLDYVPPMGILRVGESEQYRTTNLVTKLPRTITVTTTGLTQPYIDGTIQTVTRYNNLNLQIKFQYINSGNADITIVGFNQGPSGGYITLGSSGFPTKRGNPYSQVKMNTNQYAYGTNPDPTYVGSVIQHEIGHCIGFRHTDYMDRSYSCGGAASNEGASNVGGVHIPGTPTGPDANSWMLACSNGRDRTFNANDKTALNYLY